MMLKFPGGSKSRVNAAGDAVRRNQASEYDFLVIDAWRSAYAPVLNGFQELLRVRVHEFGGLFRDWTVTQVVGRFLDLEDE